MWGELVRACRAVEVPAQWLCLHCVACPEQKPFEVHIDRFCLLSEGGGKHHSYAFVFGFLIPRYVLPLEIRVDRHVGLTTSANRRDEVQRHSPTLAAEALKSLVRY